MGIEIIVSGKRFFWCFAMMTGFKTRVVLASSPSAFPERVDKMSGGHSPIQRERESDSTYRACPSGARTNFFIQNFQKKSKNFAQNWLVGLKKLKSTHTSLFKLKHLGSLLLHKQQIQVQVVGSQVKPSLCKQNF